MQTIKYEWLNVEFDLYECQLPNTHCSKICNNCGKYTKETLDELESLMRMNYDDSEKSTLIDEAVEDVLNNNDIFSDLLMDLLDY